MILLPEKAINILYVITLNIIKRKHFLISCPEGPQLDIINTFTGHIITSQKLILSILLLSIFFYLYQNPSHHYSHLSYSKFPLTGLPMPPWLAFHAICSGNSKRHFFFNCKSDYSLCCLKHFKGFPLHFKD